MLRTKETRKYICTDAVYCYYQLFLAMNNK